MDSALSEILGLEQQAAQITKYIDELDKTPESERNDKFKHRYNALEEKMHKIHAVKDEHLPQFFPKWSIATQRASKALGRMRILSERGIITEATEEDIKEIKKELQQLREQLKPPQQTLES